jgi:hypothetical protein
MSRELLKQALYALKYHSIQTRPIDLTNETIEALRQELAKPEQETFKPDWVNYRQGLADGAAQPEQEPVAWMYKGNFHDFDPSEWASPEFAVTPLYTAPPRKEWVGLTAEEIFEITERLTKEGGVNCDGWIVAVEVQQKLKEKNT